MFTPLMGEVKLLGQNVPAMQFGGGWISQPGGMPGWGPATAPATIYQAQVTPGPTPAVVPGPGGAPTAVPGTAPAFRPAPTQEPAGAPSSTGAVVVFLLAGVAAAVLS